MLRSFLNNELEPVAYLIYMLAVFLQFSRSKFFRYKVLYFFYTGCALLLYTGILFSEVNNWSYNLLFFANLIVSSWYYFTLADNRKEKSVIKYCCAFNILLFFYINVIEGRYNEYNNYVYAISFITMVVYSLLYLYRLMINMREESLLLNFDFWLICGYFLYFFGSFIIVLYYDNTAFKDDRGNLWQTHNIILFACAITTFIASFHIFKKDTLRNV